jgi:hypothetical protein
MLTRTIDFWVKLPNQNKQNYTDSEDWWIEARHVHDSSNNSWTGMVVSMQKKIEEPNQMFIFNYMKGLTKYRMQS